MGTDSDGLIDTAVDTAQAAIELKISQRRVQALIEAGHLPATRFGRTYAIKKSDLELVRVRLPGKAGVNKYAEQRAAAGESSKAKRPSAKTRKKRK